MPTPKLLAAALWLAVAPATAGPRQPAPNALRRPGETTVFSFRTSRGKVVSLCEGPKAAYLVYRFGTASRVELQYPAVLDTSSWPKFIYHHHYYDGTNNASENVNQLSFTIGTVEYLLFDNEYGFLDEYKQNDYYRKTGIDVLMKRARKGARFAGSEGSTNGNLYLTDDQRARVKLSEQP